MPGPEALTKKQAYFDKLNGLLEEYNKILLVTADNVGSKHLQSIRRDVGKRGAVLMGKNTMIRKCLRERLEEHPEVEPLIPYIRGNIGFVFTNDNLSDIKDILEHNRVGAPAKAGTIAPNDVTVPAGPTGMEPTQTSFLQALNIASKIVRGQVEIIADIKLLTAGQKVGSSEAALLMRLGIKPFSYGLIVTNVYDNGEMYSAEVLDVTDAMILGRFFEGVRNIASLGLEIGYPTAASVPHSIANAYKNVLAIALETEYSFAEADKVKEMLKNPGAFAAAAPAASAGGAAAEPAAEPEPEEESEEEDLGGGLFGDDDGW